MKIAFVYNQKPKVLDFSVPEAELYAEFDTPETIEAIRSAIVSNGYEVEMIEANEEAYEKLRQCRGKVDLVFNFAEAMSDSEDREAHVPMICEILKMPYTGPRPLAAATILDKVRCKEIWDYYGLGTGKFQLFYGDDEPLKKDLEFPLIVKPNNEGSSKGIKEDCVVKNEEEMRGKIGVMIKRFGRKVLVEEFLPGREFTVAMIGNGKKLEMLPIVEFGYKGLDKKVVPINGYEAKWLENHPAKQIEEKATCPAVIDKTLEEKIVTLAKGAFLTVDCLDWGRVDIRCDKKGEPKLMEINCPAGLLPDPKDHSWMPTAARAAGWSFEELVGKIIRTGLKRYGRELNSNNQITSAPNKLQIRNYKPQTEIR